MYSWPSHYAELAEAVQRLRNRQLSNLARLRASIASLDEPLAGPDPTPSTPPSPVRDRNEPPEPGSDRLERIIRRYGER